jgi:hypothetical protein
MYEKLHHQIKKKKNKFLLKYKNKKSSPKTKKIKIITCKFIKS